MPTKTTKLTHVQIIRLMSVMHIDERIENAELVEVVGTPVSKINATFKDHEESIYPNEEDMNFILNGIKVERNKE